MSENQNNENIANGAENTENNNADAENNQNPVREDNSKDPKNLFKNSILGTSLILGIICAAAVFAIALVNAISSPAVEKRLSDETDEAVKSLFGYDIHTEFVDGFELSAPVTEVIAVYNNTSEDLAGYCVMVEPQGFAGEIITLVAVNPDVTVKDMKILSMHETAGYGTRLNDEKWFHDQFISKSVNITDKRTEPLPGENSIQIIAGATVSSKAFLNGINAALETVNAIKEQLAQTSTAEPDITDAAGANEIPGNSGEEQNLYD